MKSWSAPGMSCQRFGHDLRRGQDPPVWQPPLGLGDWAARTGRIRWRGEPLRRTVIVQL